MLYDNYQKKILKIAEWLKWIVRHWRPILIVACSILTTVATLVALKGTVGKTTCPEQLEYGDSLVCKANAFLSPVRFEYCAAGTEEWTSTPPQTPGSYMVRGVGNAAFHTIRYGKPSSFTIVPRNVDINVTSTHVMYGDNPSISVPLVNNHHIVCEQFIYQDILSETTNVKADIDTVTIYNTENTDVTSYYSLHALESVITLNKRQIGVTVSDATHEYDGMSFTFDQYELSQGTLGFNDTLVAIFEQAITDVGSVINQPVLHLYNEQGQDVTHHYEIAQTIGSLIVETRPLIIEVSDAEITYTGSPISHKNYSIVGQTSLVSGHALEIISATQQTDCGTYNNQLLFKVIDHTGQDKTNNYSIFITPGQLTIQPRPLIISTSSQIWTYDAVLHQSEDHTAFGIVEGHTTLAIAPPAIEDVGKIENSFEVTVFDGERDVTSNYTISYQTGTLQVVSRPVIFETASSTWVYDGNTHSNIDHTLLSGDSLPADHKLIVQKSTTLTAVSECANTFEQFSIQDINGNDKTSNYTISFFEGTLKVTPRPIALHVLDVQKVYDAKPLFPEAFELVENKEFPFIEGHTVTADLIGERTEVGTSVSTLDNILITAGDENVTDNYDITVLDGNLVITPRPITLRVLDVQKVYDATPLAPEAFEIVENDEFPTIEGHEVTADLIGSRTNVGISDSTLNNILIADGEKNVTANYDITVLDGKITVTPRPITLRVLDVQKVYDATPLIPGAFEIVENKEFPTLEGHIVTADFVGSQTNVGTCESTLTNVLITAGEENVTDNYDITILNGKITVTPRPITLRVLDVQKVYDATPLAPEAFEIVENKDFPTIVGHVVTADFVGSRTNVGTSDSTLENIMITEGEENVTGNYDITVLGGKITVTHRPILLRLPTVSGIYNDTPLAPQSFEIIAYEGYPLIEGHTVSADIIGGQTDVGISKSTLANIHIFALEEEVTSNYAIEVQDGEIIVLPRPVILKVTDVSKVYDATPLRATQAEVSPNSPHPLVEGHTIKASVYGERTDAGVSASYITSVRIMSGTRNVSHNYDIVLEEGIVEVLKRPISLRVLDVEKIYDGTPLFPVTFEIVNDSQYPIIKGHTVMATPVGERVDAGTSYSNLDDIHIKANRIDVTHNYEITVVEGNITVLPRPVTVQTGSASKYYDSTPLTNSDWHISPNTRYQPLKGHQLDLAVVGSQTKVGSSANVCDLSATTLTDTFGQDVTHNYEIIVEPGTLTVLPYATVLIQTPSASKPYDGTPLTAPRYTDTVIEGAYGKGHRLIVDVTGTITEIGSEENSFTVQVLDRNGIDMTDGYIWIFEPGRLTILPERNEQGELTDATLSSSLTGSGSGGGMIFPVLNIKTNISGNIYVKQASYADYLGNAWSQARPYDQLINGIYSYQALIGMVMEQNGIPMATAEIEFLVPPYMLPYYLGLYSADYDIPTNDTYPNGSCDRIVTVPYFAYEVINGYNGDLTPIKGQYAKAELAYRAFVYDQYLKVDHETLIYMTQLIAQQGFDAKDPDIISKVAEYIQNAATYNLDYDPAMDSEANMVVAFLDTYREGVCRHYASAATLLFRALGIPARYTVGYTGAAEEGQWSTIYAPGHAWVEIYLDGIGWIAVEVTGGGPGGGGGGGGGNGDGDGNGDGGGSGEGSGEGSGGGSGGGPISGSLGDGGFFEDMLEEVPIVNIKSDYSGPIYLKQTSFGKFLGAAWADARPYDGLLNGTYGYQHLIGAVMQQNDIPQSNIELEFLADLYLLPYYLTLESGNYTPATSDVWFQGSCDSIISLPYYAYSGYGSDLYPLTGEYADQELAYRSFVYDQYLEIDDQTRAYMEQLIAKQNFDVDDPFIISKVAKYIQHAATYNLKYDRTMDEQENVVIAFLETYKEGVCRHYASAATLLFRALGIPARYTVGFSGATSADEWVTITTPGHAWTEVYLDGIGWVAVELTGSAMLNGGGAAGGGGAGGLDTTPKTKLLLMPAYTYKVYDGTPLHAQNALAPTSVLLDLLAKGYTYTVTVEGQQTMIGKSESRITSFKLYDPTGKDVTSKYEIGRKKGTVEVFSPSKPIIRLYLYQLQKYYDGSPLMFEDEDYEILSMPNGLTLEISLSGLQLTNSGSISTDDINMKKEKFITYRILRNGRDVTDDYTLLFDSYLPNDPSYLPLRVDPRPILIASASASKIYDGTPLSNSEVTVAVGSLVSGDSVVATTHPGIDQVGSALNMILSATIYNKDGIDVTENYAIDVREGTLTIFDEDES